MRGARTLKGLTIALLLSLPTPAGAQIERVQDPADATSSGDGVYGRFDGDLGIAVGAGIENDFSAGEIRLAANLHARFYQALGSYLTYRQSLKDSDPLERIVSLGASLEPLFLLRWPKAKERGPAFWDLALDSLSLSAGLFLAEPAGGNFAQVSGAEFGLGLGLPLVAKAPGPWLRTRALLMTGYGAPAGALMTYFEWQWFIESGVVK